MPGIYEHRVTVRDEEIDVQNRVNNVVYLRWMEDAATAHSATHGWTASRYAQIGAGWVARSHHVEYLQPAFVRENLVVRTWVATMKRVTSMPEGTISSARTPTARRCWPPPRRNGPLSTSPPASRSESHRKSPTCSQSSSKASVSRAERHAKRGNPCYIVRFGPLAPRESCEIQEAFR